MQGSTHCIPTAVLLNRESSSPLKWWTRSFWTNTEVKKISLLSRSSCITDAVTVFHCIYTCIYIFHSTIINTIIKWCWHLQWRPEGEDRWIQIDVLTAGGICWRSTRSQEIMLVTDPCPTACPCDACTCTYRVNRLFYCVCFCLICLCQYRLSLVVEVCVAVESSGREPRRLARERQCTRPSSSWDMLLEKAV